MSDKSFESVAQAIRLFELEERFDIIVAIANGGIIPAALLNQKLQLPIYLLKIHLRDSNQQPLYSAPQLIEPIDFKYQNKRVLLVEDRVKSGASLQFACRLLAEAALVKTFCVNGKADYSLFDESCFKFPWIITP